MPVSVGAFASIAQPLTVTVLGPIVPSPGSSRVTIGFGTGSSSLMLTVCVVGAIRIAPEGADSVTVKVSLASKSESDVIGTEMVCVAPFTDPAANVIVPLDDV